MAPWRARSAPSPRAPCPPRAASCPRFCGFYTLALCQCLSRSSVLATATLWTLGWSPSNQAASCHSRWMRCFSIDLLHPRDVLLHSGRPLATPSSPVCPARASSQLGLSSPPEKTNLWGLSPLNTPAHCTPRSSPSGCLHGVQLQTVCSASSWVTTCKCSESCK